MKPTPEELASALGLLASCFSIPASDQKHEITIVKPVQECERAYLVALDVLFRWHQ